MSANPDRRIWLAAIGLAGGAVLVAVGLFFVLGRPGISGPSAVADAASGGFAGREYAPPREAPPLRLTDQEGRPFDLASLRGTPVFIYFGYTHCPDVCPATIGVLNQVIARAGRPVHAVFVTVDPERDTVAALREYLSYLPPVYVGLTGSASDIRRTADGYGVTYARVETGSASGYAMAHTAEIYLVDAAGRLRLHYPFGTEAPAILADLERIATQ